MPFSWKMPINLYRPLRKFQKAFEIPGKPSSLPMSFRRIKEKIGANTDEFETGGDEYTWADWEREAKEKYPYRFLISETIPEKIHYLLYTLEMKWLDFYYLHIEKAHLLDMRGAPINSIFTPYKGGWMSPQETIEAAVFAAFYRFADNIHGGIKGKKQHYQKWFYSAKDPKERSNAATYVELFNIFEEIDEFYKMRLPKLIEEGNNEQIRIEITERLVEIIRLRNRMEPL